MIRVRAERSPSWGKGVGLHVLRDNLDRRPITVDALQWHTMSGDFFFTEIDEGTYGPPAPFHLDNHAAQHLMDDLYRLGFRPTDAQVSAGQLEALQDHLTDMKRSYNVLLGLV